MADNRFISSIYSDNIFTDCSQSLDEVRDELESGILALSGAKAPVSVFGSARIKQGNQYYQKAVDIGYKLAEAGFEVITGGGPGIMEAAAKGAFEADGVTYGINVILPCEQGMNEYIKIPHRCRYLFTRKVLLIRSSVAFIIMPGGAGTLDELFELLTLISTKMIKSCPVILVGSDFWSGLLSWIREKTINSGFISEKDIGALKIMDDADEIVKVLKNL